MSRRCPRCLRARCLCALLPAAPLAHRNELVLLQHPAEQYQVKGTARLLSLALARAELRVGERFDPPPPRPTHVDALLYPGAGAPPPTGATLRLFVLDGSWRQSRALLRANPWLQALPRLALQDWSPGAYGELRRAHAPGQLSTLEAVARALQQLEGLDPAPLLAIQQGLSRQWQTERARHT